MHRLQRATRRTFDRRDGRRWATLSGVQDAFAYVVFAAVGIGVVAAIVAALFSRRAYEDIGRGDLYRDADAPAAPAGEAHRDDEIRQLLTARNARRAATARPTVDVEAELERLTAPAADDALRAEIREHVFARNARRLRRGR